jgi:hypothetical protein
LGGQGLAVKPDVAASTTYRSFYVELMDGAIAEYLLSDGDWNRYRINPDLDTPGADDGSRDTGSLIRLTGNV